jgi:hypothetical protein
MGMADNEYDEKMQRLTEKRKRERAARVTRSPAENQPPIVGTPGVVTCADHRNAARCQRDHTSGRCICRPSVAENQQTVEAALDDICPAAYAVDCDLPEHAKARAARGALRDLVAQAEQWERLAHDMGEALDILQYGNPEIAALLARLDALGGGA